jgi:DNA processing protein
MTPYGRRVAQECTAACVRAGLVTVSGLAEGIDGEVARETLRTQGTHVAVLGHGLGRIFPKAHAGLAAEILTSGGALVSEYAFDAEATPYSFVGRNRIIAGLALATAVLEAPAKSGALHTAQFALDEGREVLAAPGQLFDAHCEGSLALIASGQARLIVRPEDIPSALGIDVARAATATDYEPQSPDEAAVLATLTNVPQPIDTIVLACKLPPGTVIATLTMLELAGAARNSGGGQWTRG